MLEPSFLLDFALKWVGPQLHSHYAVDYVTGSFVGPWYVLFFILLSERSFLSEFFDETVVSLQSILNSTLKLPLHSLPTPRICTLAITLPLLLAASDTFLIRCSSFVLCSTTRRRTQHTHPQLDHATNSRYSFNDWQLSRAVHTLARFTSGDALYASPTPTPVPGASPNSTVADFVVWMATYWEQLAGVSPPTAQSSSSSLSPPPLLKERSLLNHVADARDGDVCCNLTGHWFGYWVRPTPTRPETQYLTTLTVSPQGTVTASQSPVDGWATGNGTLTPSGGPNSCTVSLSLYDPAGGLRAHLTGSVINCTTIEWDNDSNWCRNGSSVECTAPTPAPPDGLADYGGASNLLECVPTYTHKVPALNAANAWLMREAADVVETTRPQVASSLRVRAVNVSAAVRSRLYVAGKGYWACEQPDGRLVEVRHVIDFATVGHALADDLSPATATEMATFFAAELRTPNWLRALSLSDAAAPQSDRKDHGPYGAYDGWLGESVLALSRLGRYADALNVTRSMAPVYDRGPGGQSHQVSSLPQYTLLFCGTQLLAEVAPCRTPHVWHPHPRSSFALASLLS